MALSGQLTYLERVVMEMVDTERTYVSDLRMVVEEYLSTMIEQVCVRPELVCSLFGNIEDIYEFNSELLQDLDLCDRDPVGVARCFVMKSQYFIIYTQYCTNYPNSVAALSECMRNQCLVQFLCERQEALQNSLPLGSYLLKPVQRILKYHLLLQEISKHFDPQQEGYQVVEEALCTMTGVAWYINDMKRKHEHAVRLQEVQSLLLGWKGAELTAYGELLLEGTFRVSKGKHRTLFLLERLLLIVKQRGEHYVYKTHLSSSTLMLMQSSKDSLSFSVAHYKHPKQAHTVQARTVEEKNQWTHHIKRIIVENHHAIIPQKAKEAILEMDSVYPLRHHFSPQRKKKTPQDSNFPPFNRRIESSNQRREPSAEQAMPPQKAEPKGVEPQRAQHTVTDEVKPTGSWGPAEDHKPLVVLSSAESSEDEDGDGRDRSILPSSVLDRARDIALHGSARRVGVASEGRVKPGGVSSNGVLLRLPSGGGSANGTPRLRRSSLVSAPPWPPLSPLDSQSERRGQGFTLTEKDQLLIGRIKAYYENAANQDEAFTLRRRDSLTFIPNGLVRDSVSRFTKNPQETPEEPIEEPCTEPGLVQNLESSSEQVFTTSSDIMKIWKEMETRKKTCTFPQNHLEKATDKTTDRTRNRTTDRTFSQMLKDSWSSQEEPEVLLPAVLPDADVGGAQRTVLNLARRFSQRIRTSSSENQHVSSVQEVALQPPQLSPTHARGHAPLSVEAFDWPDVRVLRSRYDERRTHGSMQETIDQRPSSETAPPQMLLHPCVSVAPDPAQSRILQENFVGFRVAAEAPLLTDPKHRILVLEQVPELSEEPRGAGGEDSYVQIRSPTSREKISLMAVMERCRVYEDSEENRLREQSVVRNLREKFQSLS